jgi:hypothetical protein
MTRVRPHAAVVLCLPLLLTAVSGCDLVTADLKAQETAEWRKSYELQPAGRVEIRNINGKIDVEPSTGNRVEVLALKSARGATPEAAREALGRIEILESASPAAVKIETKVTRGGGMFRSDGGEVRYTVRVPAAADVHFITVNGGIELIGLAGRVSAETTNGGVRARDMSGPIEASTTNGGVDVDLTRVMEPGVKLECTNGGIRLRIPADSKATISANVTNGGIDAGGLSIDSTESTRRRLTGRLNGGGPSIRIEGTNGGIRIASR